VSRFGLDVFVVVCLLIEGAGPFEYGDLDTGGVSAGGEVLGSC